MTFSKQPLWTAYHNINISLSYMHKTEDTKDYTESGTIEKEYERTMSLQCTNVSKCPSDGGI
jgi:hypothetical protein